MQSKQYMAQQKEKQREFDSQRAFKLLRRDEELRRKNTEWWSEIQLLKN